MGKVKGGKKLQYGQVVFKRNLSYTTILMDLQMFKENEEMYASGQQYVKGEDRQRQVPHAEYTAGIIQYSRSCSPMLSSQAVGKRPLSTLTSIPACLRDATNASKFFTSAP